LILQKIIKSISDVIYPARCVGCSDTLHHEKEKYFCGPCHEQIKYLNKSMCPVCGIAFLNSPAESHLCGKCLEKSPYFTVARAVAAYENVILETIHRFKYGRDLSVGSILASFMADFQFPDFDYRNYSLIVPVPLHVKKMRERGFNQSVILAQALNKKWRLPLNYFLLKRSKFTLTQTGLDKKEREKNIKGAFEVTSAKEIKDKNIILIDDVYTTGATLNECAKTLRKAGAKDVAVLTLARVL